MSEYFSKIKNIKNSKNKDMNYRNSEVIFDLLFPLYEYWIAGPNYLI